MVSWALIAFAHLLGVLLSTAVFARGRSLARVAAGDDVKHSSAAALRADNVWGIASMVVVPTGLYRLFAMGKGLDFYLANPFFLAKMVLFGLVFALELWPMAMLIRHRVVERERKAPVDAMHARRVAQISMVQTALLVATLLSATFMARGIGQMAPGVGD